MAVHRGNTVLRIFKVNIPSHVQVLLLYVFVLRETNGGIRLYYRQNVGKKYNGHHISEALGRLIHSA